MCAYYQRYALTFHMRYAQTHHAAIMTTESDSICELDQQTFGCAQPIYPFAYLDMHKPQMYQWDISMHAP